MKKRAFSLLIAIVLSTWSGSMAIGQAACASPDSDVVITEIMYNPASSEPSWEWIEVYNDGPATIDLSGWVLDDAAGTLSSANIPSGSLAPNGSAILYNAALSATDFEDAWGAGINLVAVTAWQGLNNGGDRIGLWDSQTNYDGKDWANVCAEVDYDDDTNNGWPSDDNSASIVLRDINGNPVDDGSNWVLSAPPFGRTSSAQAGNSGNDVGSPGEVNINSTVIELHSFTATVQDETVLLQWETAVELNNAGFNLYRATEPDGPYERVNARLIGTNAQLGGGAVYRYSDAPGSGPVFYRLEDVDADGTLTHHGPLRVTIIAASGQQQDNRRLYVPLAQQ